MLQIVLSLGDSVVVKTEQISEVQKSDSTPDPTLDSTSALMSLCASYGDMSSDDEESTQTGEYFMPCKMARPIPRTFLGGVKPRTKFMPKCDHFALPEENEVKKMFNQKVPNQKKKPI